MGPARIRQRAGGGVVGGGGRPGGLQGGPAGRGGGAACYSVRVSSTIKKATAIMNIESTVVSM